MRQLTALFLWAVVFCTLLVLVVLLN